MKLPDTVIRSDTRADAIVKQIHKRDTLSVVSEVYSDFLCHLNTKRGTNESFKIFKSRFEAQSTNFNPHSDTSKLPDALLEFMLLASSCVDGNQRISVLPALSPMEDSFNEKSTTSKYLKSVNYNSTASILRQCDKPKSHERSMSTFNSLSTYSAKQCRSST